MQNANNTIIILSLNKQQKYNPINTKTIHTSKNTWLNINLALFQVAQQLIPHKWI